MVADSICRQWTWVRDDELDSPRLDAWYYQRRFIDLTQSLRQRELFQPVNCIAGVSGKRWDRKAHNGETFLYVEIADVGLGDGSVTPERRLVSSAPSRAQIQVRQGDLIVSTVRPNRGAIAVIPASVEGVVVSTGFAVIRGSRTEDSYYLVAALLHHTSIEQIMRWNTGSAYPAVEESVPLRILIPLPSVRIRNYIGEKVRLAERCREEARVGYEAAQKRFTEVTRSSNFALRMDRCNLINADSLSERLNAEFYLPRYFDLDAHLAGTGVEVRPVGELLCEPIIRTGTPERSDEVEIPCILTSDINPMTIQWRTPSLRITQEVHDRHTGRLKADDVVYTSVGPPVGEAALVLKSYLPIAVGGDVSVIRTSKRLHPGYLCLFLNSVFGRMQNDRYARGIRQRRVYPEDIGSFLILVLPWKDQEFIGERVRRYEDLNDRAFKLVEEAKTDVEALIEGRLDVEAIEAGRLKPPAEETLLKGGENDAEEA